MSGAVSDHDDYAVEPIRGLPKMLPPGEQIVWQGAPEWWQMAKHVFHIRGVAVYLLALTAWRFSVHMQTGHGREAVVAAFSLLTIALLGLGMLALLAWLCSRTSVYTITNRRIVMRIGIALPTAINIPFKVIAAAGLRCNANGAGDISLALMGADRVAYSNLWPHVRPWRLSRPEPMLRGIANAGMVADLLAQQLAQAVPTAMIQPVPGRTAKATGGRIESASPGMSIAGGQTA